ncbi:MAG TPA: adenylate/guanylate cyclase domain-containing protein [Acidimicrobiales bacterium]|nr:adenylate/guanylate cyclase domain-containing protein [Acidimicrobiales bacterium]
MTDPTEAAASVQDARPFGLRILGRPEEPARISVLRVQLLLSGLIVTSNLVGVAAVYVLAAFVIPGPTPRDPGRVALDNLYLGLVYTAMFTAAVVTWGRRFLLEKTMWLRSGGRPDESQQKAVIRIPLILATFQATYWLVAAVLFAGFNSLIEDRLPVQIGLTMAISGLLTSADSYLLGETIVRPLAARALASGPPPGMQVPGVRARALLAWLLSSAVPVTGLMLVAAAALTRPGITTTRLAVTVLVLGGLVLAFGLRSTLAASRANADPIRSLRRAMMRIGAGDLDVAVPIYDGTEIGQLQAGFNDMAAGLRERERIRSVFEHHVGEDVARTALDRADVLGGGTCEVGVFFVDIVGSTGLAVRLPPDEVVGLLNRFFAVVVDVAARHGGQVNKFEGDGALVVFGAPVALENPARAALAAGRELAEALVAYSDLFEVGVGISAGPVVAGNIGSAARYEYTVIGDPVNEAARLTDLAKGSRGRVLASWAAVETAGPEEGRCWEKGEEVNLRGRPARTRLATPATPA